MASNFKLSTTARNKVGDGIKTYMEALGSTSVRVEIYTGSPPTNVADALTGTKLATMTFSNGWYATSNGILEADGGAATGESSAPASGDAGYFRIYRNGESGTGPAVCQGTCGEAADSPDLVFTEKTIVIGSQVQNTSWTFTVPIS